MKKILIVVCLAALFIEAAQAQKNILIYTKNGKGYVHDNIPAAVEALKKLSAENGYKAESTDDPAVFTPDKLKKYRCIIFASTNNEGFDTEQQKQAFVDYIRGGGGFVGIHSASGSERKWPWFAAMLGGR
ncbi:MAG TPA: ThuA domain-containing protein, partial [Chryseolinea sp.]